MVCATSISKGCVFFRGGVDKHFVVVGGDANRRRTDDAAIRVMGRGRVLATVVEGI